MAQEHPDSRPHDQTQYRITGSGGIQHHSKRANYNVQRHWQNKVNIIIFLYNNKDILKDILIHVYEDAYKEDSKDTFILASDTYVDIYCIPKEDTASRIYPSRTCDKENTCYVCELQLDNLQNAIRKHDKCTCCEVIQEEYL